MSKLERGDTSSQGMGPRAVLLLLHHPARPHSRVDATASETSPGGWRPQLSLLFRVPGSSFSVEGVEGWKVQEWGLLCEVEV